VELAASDEAPEGVVIAGKGKGKGSGVLYFHPQRRQMEACGLRSSVEMDLHMQDEDKVMDQVITRRAEVKYERIDKLPEDPKEKKKEELPRKPSDLKPETEPPEPLEDVEPSPTKTP
jgi:ribosomal protein L24